MPRERQLLATARFSVFFVVVESLSPEAPDSVLERTLDIASAFRKSLSIARFARMIFELHFDLLSHFLPKMTKF